MTTEKSCGSTIALVEIPRDAPADDPGCDHEKLIAALRQ
jgi:hypothetical protein